MDNLKAKLLAELQKIEGVEDRASPVSGGSALYHNGKSFAHFHNDNELDLRLTRKIIKAFGLTHPTGSIHHPNRSPNSAWIELRFNKLADIETVSKLVKLAVAEL
jgi:hypothetical protein